MHDALHEHSDVRILESFDARAAAVTVRKECVRLAGNLLEEWVAVTAEERHERVRRTCSCPWTIQPASAPRRP